MMKKGLASICALTALISSCSFIVPSTSADVSEKEEQMNQIDEEPNRIVLDYSSAKRVYELGEELNLDSLLVFLYRDGQQLAILDEYEVTEVDTSTPGRKEVIIKNGILVASFSIIVKGYVYHNYDEKYVYFLGETFNRDYFSLIKYDESGEHIINDYDVSFPNNTEIGLGQIVITYEDFVYRSDIAIMKKQDNVPVIFASNSDSRLLLFANNIHKSTYYGEKCVVSEGNYLLIDEKEELHLFDYKYMLYGPLNASYFGCSDHNVIQRLIPGGDLLVTIGEDDFIVEASIWHHCLIGW